MSAALILQIHMPDNLPDVGTNTTVAHSNIERMT